ncbi:hypothetical protein OG585_55430 (plasmid) [Streptomyces sp. NBC_01340]|uniref:hypothetical protein n=1 Tax=Streptomyces sp. NBC_01340 TaxID=2903830 RepID=UPI002E0E081B|nr:hypothetical protein OG585_00050 [Streptomyces sp. NBC_01340]WSI43929.1 hypothetical protein OG585_46870 [Streptomyces sp. NBC_01340]WSI45864.1 hypothetical protein OG585_55430 [Streptomyces sp. NBC_01340]
MTAAALQAHAPGAGCITVHPTPAVTTPAALAQDVLHALGKTIIGTSAQHGTWADSLQPAWAATAAWVRAHGIHHLIVTRTHQLTTRRIQQLLDLRRHTGIELTLLWHTRPTPALTQALDGTEHHMSEDLDTALGQLQRAQHTPPRRSTASGHWEADRRQRRHHVTWIAPPSPSPGEAVSRPPRTSCPGADHAPPTSAGTASRTDETGEATSRLAARLHTLAHPLHAAALTTTILTGTGPRQLALIRGIDINASDTRLKTHDSPAHRRCHLHPVPAWAQTLLNAARLYQHHTTRPPDSALFPLITAHNNITLTACAEALHLRLNR